ncbi:predicted protein [Naegleria gruberi]|uniref:Predicted protein n=1 Tax=Naegleria gruberi TaxID=5762 RepID=D2VGR0_NAEGR|nr:uncharacterized protein NAEGRDRAFT_68065 [Naegleria gruberi]EFC44011.1 predicted protein [Naegleria gruberi]|eukprot:XP_002676755.1 predicted protein [Naegleria gruberi strain NEG-M]
MKNSQRFLNLLLLFTLFFIGFIIISKASINTVSFGSFACDDSTSTTRCTSASLEIVNNASSNSFDSLSYSSYDNNGEKIDLGTTLKFDTKIISSRARVFFAKDNQIIYNKYELFEPSISCAVNPMNKCFEAKRVLCCLNGKRGTGVFCLKEEEPSSYTGLRRAYQVYRMVGKKYIYKVTMKISQNGRSRDFTFSEDNTIVSTSNVQASIFYQHQTEQQTIFSNLQTISDNYVLMRMMHLGTASGYNQIQPSEVLLVEKLSNFLTNQYSYYVKATCNTEFGQATQTHTNSENKDDQFYNSENLYGIKNVLNQKFEIPKVDTTSFGNTVGDESGVDYFEFDINTPSISLNLLINNIYDI